MVNNNDNLIHINKGSMIFCRTVFAIILWIAFFFKIKFMVIVSAVIMFLNTFLTIEYAPFIVLYEWIIEPKKKTELINIAVMQIMHFFIFCINLISIVFLYFLNERVGYIIVCVLACAKTIAACGFCPVSRITNCSVSGCCLFGKNKIPKREKVKKN